MKFFFIFLITSFSTFATECSLFQLKGTVTDNNGFRLSIHEGTNSEKFFVFPKVFDLRMAAYTKKYIEGKFILKNKEPVSGAEIVGIESTELAVPDPLHHHQEILFLRNIPCPMTKKKGP